MFDGLRALHEVIDGVTGMDLEPLSDADLHHLAIGLMTETARLAAARAAVIAA